MLAERNPIHVIDTIRCFVSLAQLAQVSVSCPWASVSRFVSAQQALPRWGRGMATRTHWRGDSPDIMAGNASPPSRPAHHRSAPVLNTPTYFQSRSAVNPLRALQPWSASRAEVSCYVPHALCAPLSLVSILYAFWSTCVYVHTAYLCCL